MRNEQHRRRPSGSSAGSAKKVSREKNPLQEDRPGLIQGALPQGMPALISVNAADGQPLSARRREDVCAVFF